MNMNTFQSRIRDTISLDKARFTEEEKALTHKFSLKSNITWADSIIFKKIRYAYFFSKPPREVKELFNIKTEVLTLYLTEKFEHKTVDCIDKLVMDFPNRLDKNIFLIVSNEANISSIVSEFKKRYHDDRIFIARTFIELMHPGTTPEKMWDIREIYNETDLFAFTNPLSSDAYFYGRNKEVKHLYQNYILGQNSGLFGLRRIGKTSVLFALLRLLKHNNQYGKYFDLEDTAIQKRKWYEVLQYIIESISKDLESEEGRSFLIEEYTEKNASDNFRKNLKDIYHILGNKRILLIFDEIEKIIFDSSYEEHWKKGSDFINFWRTLRAINQSESFLFSYVVAGTNPKIVEMTNIKGFENPIYRGISVIYLPFFNVDQIEEMVNGIGRLMGLTFEKSIYTHLKNDFGGHPFLIRLACSSINKKVFGKRPNLLIKEVLYKSNKKEIALELYNYVEIILSVLIKDYPDEYKLLKDLAFDDQEVFKRSVNSFPTAVQHLKGYNLVESDDDEKQYHISLDLVKNYLRNDRIKDLELKEITKESSNMDEKRSVINNRRTRIEFNLRKLIRQKLIYSHGNKSKTKFIEIIGKVSNHSINRFNDKELEDVLGNYSATYFKELISFIAECWHEGYNIFKEKKTFEYYAECINKSRGVDAHANDISDRDYNQLLLAFEWMEEKLDSYLK